MDQVILDILSIVIGGAGLFVVITKYNIQETRMNFYGETNVFREKASVIDDVMTWIFTLLSILGLFALIIKDIYGEIIPERLHAFSYYWLVFLLSLSFAFVLVNVLDWFGKKIARRRWLPLVKNGFREAFEDLTKNNLIIKNPERGQRIIELIEKALDVKVKRNDLSARFEVIKVYFE